MALHVLRLSNIVFFLNVFYFMDVYVSKDNVNILTRYMCVKRKTNCSKVQTIGMNFASKERSNKLKKSCQ